MVYLETVAHMVEVDDTNDVVLIDSLLSARLERTEGLANARFVEARARQSADSTAVWIEVAGAYALFDGPDSPLTQSFGLGMQEEVTPADFETIEAFFRDRHAPVYLEVSPLSSGELHSPEVHRNAMPNGTHSKSLTLERNGNWIFQIAKWRISLNSRR